MRKPSQEQIIQWARTVWPGVFRGDGPLLPGYTEFAELAYAAGRKEALEEAAGRCKKAASESQSTCDALAKSGDFADRLSALIARGAVEQAKKLESSIRAAMEADK